MRAQKTSTTGHQIANERSRHQINSDKCVSARPRRVPGSYGALGSSDVNRAPDRLSRLTPPALENLQHNALIVSSTPIPHTQLTLAMQNADSTAQVTREFVAMAQWKLKQTRSKIKTNSDNNFH